MKVSARLLSSTSLHFTFTSGNIKNACCWLNAALDVRISVHISMLVTVHVLSVYNIFRQGAGTNLFLDLLYDYSYITIANQNCEYIIICNILMGPIEFIIFNLFTSVFIVILGIVKEDPKLTDKIVMAPPPQRTTQSVFDQEKAKVLYFLQKNDSKLVN